MTQPTALFCCTSLGLLLIPSAGGHAQPPKSVSVARPLVRTTADFDFHGRVESVGAVAVRASHSGVIGKVLVKQGAEVKKGEPLFEFDPASFQEAVRRAEDTLKEGEEELQRRQTILEEASKLSATDRKELSKNHDDALRKVNEPLEAAHKQAATLLGAGLPLVQREPLQQLFGALDSAARLARARTGPAFDAFLEGKLAEVRPIVLRLLLLGRTEAKGEAGKQFLTLLRTLLETIDRVELLSRARSREGIEVLAAERELADITRKNARTTLDLLKEEQKETRLVAPISGRILELKARPGERVRSDPRSATLLCTIAATDRVRVAFTVDGPTLLHLRQLVREGKLKLDNLAEVPVRFALTAEQGFPHQGHVEDVSAPADTKTGRVTVYAVFPGTAKALAASLLAPDPKNREGRARVTLGRPRQVLLVPQAAVGTSPEGKRFVLVVGDRNRAESRPVQLGLMVNAYQAVEEGLKETDRVIVGVDTGRAIADGTPSPEDFTADIKFVNLRPGTIVAPREFSLPDPEAAFAPTPPTRDPSSK